MLPTQSQVRELFDYNSETGELIWRYRPNGYYCWNGRWPGKPAGTRISGGWHVGVLGKLYLNHRVIWLWMTGFWPTHEIDHKNGDPFDNRWDNLREATSRQNKQNRRPRSKKGMPKGVSPCKGKFQAAICVDGVRKHLGTFPTPTEAHDAYRTAAVKFFGEYARFE